MWAQPFAFGAYSSACWIRYQISYIVILHFIFGIRQRIKFKKIYIYIYLIWPNPICLASLPPFLSCRACSNFSKHQKPEAPAGPRFLGPIPWIPDSVGLGRGLRFVFLTCSRAMLLVWEPHFENHCFSILYSFNLEKQNVNWTWFVINIDLRKTCCSSQQTHTIRKGLGPNQKTVYLYALN